MCTGWWLYHLLHQVVELQQTVKRLCSIREAEDRQLVSEACSCGRHHRNWGTFDPGYPQKQDCASLPTLQNYNQEKKWSLNRCIYPWARSTRRNCTNTPPQILLKKPTCACLSVKGHWGAHLLAWSHERSAAFQELRSEMLLKGCHNLPRAPTIIHWCSFMWAQMTPSKPRTWSGSREGYKALGVHEKSVSTQVVFSSILPVGGKGAVRSRHLMQIKFWLQH